MSNTVIEVENLSKRFLLRHEESKAVNYLALRDVITHKISSFFKPSHKKTANKRFEEFLALNDVCFNVNSGDRIGIVGRNGAGKSTLLKVLSRITEPSSGSVSIKGRVASLLEVGTGFHPELTGRENIFLNGAILGMRRDEIRRKFDAIVDFAEVEKFLDTPVKRYSSGMYVRLAFSVAAFLEPEILIVDEVLAVGDVQFQKKCLGKMEDVSLNQGRTIIFVSHNLAALKAICNTGILLDGGQLKIRGGIQEVINAYNSSGSNEFNHFIEDRLIKQSSVVIEYFGVDKKQYCLGDIIKLKGKINTNNDYFQHLSVLIYNEHNERIAIIDLREFGLPSKQLHESLTFEMLVGDIQFLPGIYRIGLYIVSNWVSGNIFDLISFEVYENQSELIKFPMELRGYIVPKVISNSFTTR